MVDKMKKNPSVLIASDKLTKSQREAIGVGVYVKRERKQDEAMPIQICNASTQETYRTGHGEVNQPIRPGADNAMKIASRGF